MLKKIKQVRNLTPIFIASFFVALNYGAVVFINSSLLVQFFSRSVVSLLFVIGALGNIALFLLTPKLIDTFGKKKLFLLFLLIIIASTTGLAFAKTGLLVALFFIIYSSLFFMVLYFLDIFLEEVSEDTRTGELRGIYIALTHIGLMIGLIVLSILTVESVFTQVYVVAALLLAVPVLIAIFSLKSHTPKWHGLHRQHHILPFDIWWEAKSIRRATLARFTLEFFYVFMAIYVPIYLNTVIGFSWSVIGVMFIIMLIPFVAFQWPVGKIADHVLGEKEIMIVGFLCIIISLLLMPGLKASILLWTLALFLSRVGASAVDITTDSYFFKHIDAYDIRLLSIYRLTRPLSVVLGALVGALSLRLFSFEHIFFVLAFIVFFGLKEALLIRDTR